MKFQNFKLLLINSLLIISYKLYATLKALDIASSGMAVQEENVSTISNNIANINTNGYKKNRAEFESLLYQTIKEPGSYNGITTKNNVGIQIGSGAVLSSVRRDLTQGNLKITNNPFDLMIEGDGYFGVQLPDQSILYTRDGSFGTNADGSIVNPKGYKIVPNIVVPQNTKNINITRDGTVYAYLSKTDTGTVIGQISIFTFANPVGLRAKGGNLFAKSEASGLPITNIAGQGKSGKIRQGALETSNVKIMNEMTELIRAQRAYEINAKVMRATDEMLQTINNIR